MKNKIENFKTEELKNNEYLKPLRASYVLNGKCKDWEVVKSHDSVAILLYHTQKKAFLFVNQFRAAVYLKDSSKTFTYELCAGLVDKNLSLKQIAKEEIDEECGYDVKLENIEEITSFYTNVGFSGGKQTIFFATIDDSLKVHDGGGINDEQIELFYLPVEKAEEFIFDETKAKTPGLMFGLYWFMRHKKEFLNDK